MTMSSTDIPDDPAGDPDDAPEIGDREGIADNLVNWLILVAPWVGIAAVGIYLVTTGSLSTSVTIGGTVPIRPFAYLAGGLLGVTYLLAVLRFYGTSPVQAAGMAIDVDTEAQTFQKVGLQNRGVPDGVFSMRQDVTREEYEQARERLLGADA